MRRTALKKKVDMARCGSPLLRARRTWAVALHMSGFDPKRTWLVP